MFQSCFVNMNLILYPIEEPLKKTASWTLHHFGGYPKCLKWSSQSRPMTDLVRTSRPKNARSTITISESDFCLLPFAWRIRILEASTAQSVPTCWMTLFHVCGLLLWAFFRTCCFSLQAFWAVRLAVVFGYTHYLRAKGSRTWQDLRVRSAVSNSEIENKVTLDRSHPTISPDSEIGDHFCGWSGDDFRILWLFNGFYWKW